MDTNKQTIEHPMKTQMVRDGVTLGALVELVLHESTYLNTQTTTVPTYYPSDKKSQPRACAGYVVEMTDEIVGLLPVWDKARQEHPDLMHVGGINVSWDVIQSYRKL